MGDPINKRLQSRAIRHGVFLDRYNATVEREVLGYLNSEVYPEVLAKLQARIERIRLRGFDSGFETTARYRDMLADLTAILTDGHEQARQRLRKIARELAKVEARWQLRAIEESVPRDAHVLVMPSQPVNLSVVQAVVNRPMQGRVDREWWGDLTKATAAKLKTQIGLGLSTGETQDQIVQRVRGTRANGYRDGVLEVPRQQAAAIVRTTTATVTEAARTETFRQMEDVLDGVQWIATLDTRTCPICGPRDGKVYAVNDPTAPKPPAHWNCRCVTAPVVKSFRELAGLKPRAASQVSEGTRASIDGQVPESVTWQQWIDEQPAERQDEAFGPRRGQLYRAGKITARDLATRTGRLRTVAELERS